MDVMRALDASGIDAVDLNRRQATLDDVFLTLTGSTGHADEPTTDHEPAEVPRMTTTTDALTDPIDGLALAPVAPLPHERRGGLAAWWSDTSVFAGRNIEHIRQIPEKLLDVTLQPLMFVLLFAYVFGGAIAVERRHLPRVPHRRHPHPVARVRADRAGHRHRHRPHRRRHRPVPLAAGTRSAYLSGHFLAELAGMALSIVDPARRRPHRRLAACTPTRCAFGGALAAAGAVRSAMIWIGTWIGLIGPLARRGHGRGVRRRVPAHVPEQRVRADRHAADCAAVLRGVEPGQRADRRDPRAVRQPDRAHDACTAGRSTTRCSRRSCTASCCSRSRCPRRCVATARARATDCSRSGTAPVRPSRGGGGAGRTGTTRSRPRAAAASRRTTGRAVCSARPRPG